MSWLATCSQLSCLPWGIGTGWSTSLPNYHPRDIIANLQRQWRSLAFLLSSLEHTSSCHQISRAGIFDANLCRSLAKPFREREDLKSMTTQQKHTNTITGSRLLQEMCPWYAGFKGSLVLFLAQLLFWTNPILQWSWCIDTDRAWDSLSDFAETSSLQAEWKLDSCSLSEWCCQGCLTLKKIAKTMRYPIHL